MDIRSNINVDPSLFIKKQIESIVTLRPGVTQIDSMPSFAPVLLNQNSDSNIGT